MGKIGKRWGKKFVDNRDWVKYNEELVVRGEFLLDLDWVESWDAELEKMNEGKRGAPYVYPESLIELQAVWHQWFDYRGIEGITRKLAEHGLVPEANDYTTANRRIRKVDVSFDLPTSGKVNVACDGSGLRMTNGGSYREDKHGKKNKKKDKEQKDDKKKNKENENQKDEKKPKKKKYVKVTISADPKTKELLDCTVSIEGEGPSEPEVAEEHMENLIENGVEIEQFWGDGAFDCFDLFEFCEEHSIEPAIKIRSNAVLWGDSPPLRIDEIIMLQWIGYDDWAFVKDYGMRWPGTEGIFSAVKRKFGETLRSTKEENMIHEAKTRFWVYERMRKYAAA